MVEIELRGARQAEPRGPDQFDNRTFVLVLQHPQERKEALATAAAACATLRRSALLVGLSWPNLGRALGRPADARRWAVLYLGATRPVSLGLQQEIIALGRDGMPLGNQDAAFGDIEGAVLLDGSWSEAKTLWWRNPWLLKLRRLVLNPPSRSRFGQLRREPRAAALSTIEAVAILLKHLEGSSEIETLLLGRLDRLIAEARTTRAFPRRLPSGSRYQRIRHG